jgi:hypothetical protein
MENTKCFVDGKYMENTKCFVDGKIQNVDGKTQLMEKYKMFCLWKNTKCFVNGKTPCFVDR